MTQKRIPRRGKNVQKDLTIAILIAVAVAGVTLVTPVLVFFWGMAPPWQGLNETKVDFFRNKEKIIIVRDYLVNSGFDSIYIPSSMEPGMMSAGAGIGRVPISDAEVVEVIQLLHRRGYRVISKGTNAVVFLRWSGFDVGRGIFYSIAGCTYDDHALPFLTWFEPLSIEGWYY